MIFHITSFRTLGNPHRFNMFHITTQLSISIIDAITYQKSGWDTDQELKVSLLRREFQSMCRIHCQTMSINP